MNQIKDAKIVIESGTIFITKDETTLSIIMDSQFWKNEENRKVMYEIYPDLKSLLEI